MYKRQERGPQLPTVRAQYIHFYTQVARFIRTVHPVVYFNLVNGAGKSSPLYVLEFITAAVHAPYIPYYPVDFMKALSREQAQDCLLYTSQYKEIAEIPLVCLCSCKHPLAGQSKISLEELRNEKLVLFVPARATISIAQIQEQLMGERSPSEFYFCESAEALTVLVTAGDGVSVLPDYLVPDSPLIAKIPLKDTEPMSFGIYYLSLIHI